MNWRQFFGWNHALVWIIAIAMGLVGGGCIATRVDDAVTSAEVISTNSVPIESNEDEEEVVSVKLNGHPARLVLDTGSTHVLLYPDTAAAVGIHGTGRFGFIDLRGELGSITEGTARLVELGPARAQDVRLIILPQRPDDNSDGLLGLSFLRHFVFRIDHEQSRLLFESSADNLPRNGSAIPLRYNGHRLTVEATVDGIPARLIVDTGTGSPLILQSWFIEQHNLQKRYPRRLSGAGRTMLGPSRLELVRLQSLTIGGYTITNEVVNFNLHRSSPQDGYAGFIGTEILRRFNLTFDIGGGQLWLQTNASFQIEPLPYGTVRAGMLCQQDGTNWTVAYVVEGSPTADAGVREGDRVLEIDGKAAHSLKLPEVRSAFQSKVGTRLRLRLQTGEEPPREVTLTLRDLL